MRSVLTAFILTGVFLLQAAAASGQSARAPFEVGVQVSAARSSQFDTGDVGFGGRLAWRASGLLGLEAEVNLYPSEFPDGRAFSRRRLESLFGLTAGPTFGGVRPFARLRVGALSVADAPRAFPCILIYPPPLACALASGRTLVALDLGGGVEMATSPRTFVRVDVGDRLVRYPGPVFDVDRERRDDAFFSHDFRVAAGAGLRF